jgi:diguanylate cyclase (GGDEF)-like protein
MLAWVCGFVLVGAALAQSAGRPPLALDAVLADGSALVGRQVEYLEDPLRQLTIDTVQSPEWAARFKPSRVDQPNFGYSASAYWFRFTLAPVPPSAGLLLEVGLPSLDSVQLYTPEGAAYGVKDAGDQLPWDARLIRHRNYLFALSAPVGAPATYYLRVHSSSVVTVPLTLWTAAALADHERHAQLAYGLFYGLLIALCLYNLALLLALRDLTYLYYVAYVASMGLGLFVFDGFAFEYLWPTNVWWANQALATMFSAAIVFASVFARNFLSTSVHEPKLDRVAVVIAAAAAAISVCSATGSLLNYSQLMQMVSALAAAGATLYLVIAIRGLARGFRPARFFLLAWSTMLVCIMLGALRNFAILPTNFLTMNGLHLGLAFDVLLLSFALGDRINLLRRDKLDAQAALLDGAQRHERELAARVEERTLALEDANRKLRVEAFERESLLRKLGESETRMRHLAQHDALTGLPNRLSLHERFELGAEYAKRNRHKLAVMLIDLDRFKELNDTRGHAAGDEALVALGGRLRTTVRGSDTVARLGGDEFVVLAADLDERDAVRPVIDKVSDVIGIPVSAGGGAWSLSASIGVAFYPDDAQTLDDLLKLADRAMYSDKVERKRRGVHFPTKP